MNWGTAARRTQEKTLDSEERHFRLVDNKGSVFHSDPQRSSKPGVVKQSEEMDGLCAKNQTYKITVHFKELQKQEKK